MVTAAEVLKIAKKAGFEFTREQFERAVKSYPHGLPRRQVLSMSSRRSGKDPLSSCA